MSKQFETISNSKNAFDGETLFCNSICYLVFVYICTYYKDISITRVEEDRAIVESCASNRIFELKIFDTDITFSKQAA